MSKNNFKLKKKQIKVLREKIKELKGVSAKKCHLSSEDFESLFDLDPEGAQLLLESFDLDKNGTVEWTEFIGGITVLSSEALVQKADLLFTAWDMDNNSILDKEEIRQMLTSVITIAATVQLCEKISVVQKKLGEVFDSESFEDRKSVRESIEINPEDLSLAVEQFFDEVDVNKDGVISLQEFYEYCGQNPESVEVFEKRVKKLFQVKKGKSCIIM
ncbi:calcium binding protein [Anaeramoeba flamelloides]|uniref:Calcium binding protein n=1 Tax=Anaeramoeba flamelloides TaxID=1746091 RepID=A0AAV7Y9S9_9EUKA|nr:calcium binding protein [Anaeramoeba flamelloides]